MELREQRLSCIFKSPNQRLYICLCKYTFPLRVYQFSSKPPPAALSPPRFELHSYICRHFDKTHNFEIYFLSMIYTWHCYHTLISFLVVHFLFPFSEKDVPLLLLSGLLLCYLLKSTVFRLCGVSLVNISDSEELGGESNWLANSSPNPPFFRGNSSCRSSISKVEKRGRPHTHLHVQHIPPRYKADEKRKERIKQKRKERKKKGKRLAGAGANWIAKCPRTDASNPFNPSGGHRYIISFSYHYFFTLSCCR